MIGPAQLNALARSLSLTSAPSASQPGVVTISLTPDPTALLLPQIDPGQTVTALVKLVRFADAAIEELGGWTAKITETQLTGGVATYTFSGATGTPQAGQMVAISGCSDPTYNVSSAIFQVLDSTHFTIKISSPSDIMFAGGQSGLAFSNNDILTYLGLANNLLGGQAVPTIQVPLPGPGLPVIPPLPNLQDDSGLSLGQRLHDLLKGVPGIIAHVEQRGTPAIPASIEVWVDWTVSSFDDMSGAETVRAQDSRALPFLNFLPLPDFARLGGPLPLGANQFKVTATVRLSAPGGVRSETVNLGPIVITVPQIGVPTLGALFTWRSYGTEAPSHGGPADTNPLDDDNSSDDTSTLLLIPADSPLSDVPSIIPVLNQLIATLEGLASTFGLVSTLGPVAAGIVVDQLISPATYVVASVNLTSAAAGMRALINALSYTTVGHSDFRPVVVVRAKPAPGIGLGGISDLNADGYKLFFDHEGVEGYDNYYDHIKSALIIGFPGTGLEVHSNQHFVMGNGYISMMTQSLDTPFGALFVGIRDLSHAGDTTDPAGASVTEVPAPGYPSPYKHTESVRFLP